MKKLLFSAALLVAFSYLPAQTNISQKEKPSTTEEILSLQKSNASLRNQVKEQKLALLKQIQKTDSVIAVLQSANSEIKKGAENQNSNSQSVSKLNEQTKRISQAFYKRKLYAIIAFVGSIILVLIFLTYLGRKFASVNQNIKTNEENLNNQLTQMNGHLDKEIADIKATIEKQRHEFILAKEKQMP